MNINELKLLQNYPLELKIAKTKLRIQEWVDHYGEEGVYISFSGGKDSTVLLHLVRSLYPDIEAVFCDTGLEYPEIKEFVKKQENITIVRPAMGFKEVLTKYGYPVISKENSQYLYEIRTGTEKLRDRRINGDAKGRYKLPKKYHYLIDAPFKVSHKCCDVMKKTPIKKYEKETGKVAFIGTMAEESNLRRQQYLKNGCNAFDLKRPHSTPLGFWTQSDILEYIKTYNLEIAKVYGDIVVNNEGQLTTSGVSRTGCVFCMFGVHLEDPNNNRFHKLEKTHPKLHNYCMNKLGMSDVLDYMNVKYSKNKEVDNEQLSLLD